jgi:hypothetical protein
MTSPETALLDRSVLWHMVTVEPIVREETVQWGDHTASVPVTGMRRKPKQLRDEWVRDQVAALPMIARLARDGMLKLYTYAELRFEGFHASTGLRGIKGDLLGGLKIEHLPAAVERSKFQQSDIFVHAQRERFNEFYEFLLNLPDGLLESTPNLWARFSDFEQSNLRNLARFREISQHIPAKHYADAYHLWTAEVNDLGYFLTMDKKFINFMAQTVRCKLPCVPITPRDLVAGMGITELDPLPIDDSEFHYIFEP